MASSFVPDFQLWNSTGTILIYTFPAVNSTNLPQSVPDSVEITNLRSSSGIEIDGGNDKPFNAEFTFILSGTDYVDLTNTIEELENTVLTKTPYLLRLQRSDLAGDYFEYKIKRLQPFQYGASLRLKIQPVTAIFRANCW